MWRASSAATIKKQLLIDLARYPNSSIFIPANATTREKIFLSRRLEEEEPVKQSLRRQRLGVRPKLLPTAPLPTSTPRRALRLPPPPPSSPLIFHKGVREALKVRRLSKAKCAAEAARFVCNFLPFIIVSVMNSSTVPPTPVAPATLRPSGQISAPAPINTMFRGRKKRGYKSS